MALYAPKNTLAYASSRVFCRHRNMGDVPASRVAAAMRIYMDTIGPVVAPETDALWFYGMNHGMALIGSERAPLEPLAGDEAEMVAAYHQELGPRTLRAFYYLLAICTREFRHCKNLDGVAIEVGVKFGKALTSFFLKAGGETEILNRFLHEPPNATIGGYVKALVWGFYNGKFAGGYGGPAWGKVADCLDRFVDGTYSPEMMMDTIWTLSHNNGPIFNKGMLYQQHTHQLIQLLDVQRSGQIPHMILEGYLFQKQTPAALRGWMTALSKTFPGKIGSYVDWFVVEALGSVGKYPEAKAAQTKKHGKSPMAEKLEAIAAANVAALAAKAEAEAQAQAEKAAAAAKGKVEIMPGVFVTKGKMKRAA